MLMQGSKNVKKSGFFNSNRPEMFSEANNYDLLGKGMNLPSTDYPFPNQSILYITSESNFEIIEDERDDGISFDLNFQNNNFHNKTLNSLNLCQNGTNKTLDNSFASSDMMRFPDDEKRFVEKFLN